MISIEIKSPHIKKLKNLKKILEKDYLDLSKSSATIIKKEIIDQARNSNAIALENFIKSVDIVYTDTVDSSIAEIGSDLEYAKALEFGQEPGKNISERGIDNILEWMQAKGITDATRDRAYAIALSIKDKGTEGKFIFTKAFDAYKDKLARYLTDELNNKISKI